MGANRWLAVGMTVVALLGAQWLPSRATGQEGDSAGVITEIKIGRGRIEVKRAGTAEWRQATPLLALRAGDAVRATENARAVVLLSGGRGSVKVAAASSPFVVPAREAGEGKVQKARALLAASLNFLSSGSKELPQAVLATRAASKPPVVLSPRNSAMLPDSLAFEWLGSRFARYTIRIGGPAGVVLEVKNLKGGRFDYPPDAPRLTPGTRYTLQVLAAGHPPQEAWFEVLDAARAQAVRRDLLALDQELGPSVSSNTLLVARVGFLANNGLLHDARRSLVEALAKDPDEPTFHQLLGNLYAQTGLFEQAAESFEEAQFLSTRGVAEPPPVKR